MSRYRGPRVRIVRRLGNLPGLTNKLSQRDTLPGQHRKVRGKQNNVSSYSIRLQEKQKLKYNYGLTEKQLLGYVKKAKRLRGATGGILLQLLEMRLDNVVFRLGLANTIPASRQIVNHGHIYVNGEKTTIPSFQCQPDDIIEVRNKSTSRSSIDIYMSNAQKRIPSFLEFEREKLRGKVVRIVDRKEVDINVNELLIVEYYSRK